jgi:hypothetical protein
VLLTAPSLRSGHRTSTFDDLSKTLRRRGPELWDGEKHSMMVLLGYFFIAAFAGVAFGDCRLGAY